MNNIFNFDINVDLKKLDINEYIFLYKYSEYSTPFHSLEYLSTIQNSRKDLSLKFNILYLEEKILAVMPFFKKKFVPFAMVSLPYGCYGGYLYLKKDEIYIKDFLKKFPYKFFFKINSYNNNIYKLINNINYEKQYTWVIDISIGYEKLFEKLHSKTKNQIRKALKEGIEVKNIMNIEELKQVIEIYSQLVKKHNIKKPYNKKLFESLYKKSLFSENVLFKIAKKDEKVISFSIFLKNSTQIFYWLNASHHNYLKYNGTNAILNEVLKFASENNLIEFNLGAVPRGNKGLEHFKNRWNATKKSYYIFKRIF